MRQRESQTDLNRIVKTNLKYQAKEFFSNSTLHGVRYVAEEGRSFSEKFMWFCFVSISTVSAFVIIASLWEKFQTNPTITGLDTDFHLSEFEFPSVTLCPDEPYNLTVLEEFAKGALSGHSNETFEINIEMLQAISKLSYDNLKNAAVIASKISNETQKNWNKYTLRSAAFRVAKSCQSIFNTCKFRGELKDCCEIFFPVYSERGFCMSFNQRYSGTETSEELLGNFNKISETDKSWSLELDLVGKSSFYLHSVMEVFSYDSRIQFIYENDSSSDILLSMKQTYTTDDASQLTTAQRKCIFPDLFEVQISYYKDEEYSLTSCMKECRMENAIQFCKCIPPFYAPVKSRNNRYCELKDFGCLSKNTANITSIRRCQKCQLSCLNTVFDIEKTSLTHEKDAEKARSVNIEFLTWPIIRYKREVLFGWVDLLVSFGGIAGLFLGFSLLSAIEIVYYFTIRASCMMYKNRQKLYELQTEQDNQPPTTYDLSMKISKFNGITTRSSVRIIKPVDPVDDAGYVDGIKDNALKGGFKFSRAEKIDRYPYNNDLTEQNVDLKIPTQRKPIPSFGVFRSIPIAPYSENIKPLDRNYRRPVKTEEESDLVYYGYLP